MKFVETNFSQENRYALGVDERGDRYFASIPVSNGIADYEEFYELTESQFNHFRGDPSAAIEFIEECRRRKHHDLLMQKSGWNRGTPV